MRGCPVTTPATSTRGTAVLMASLRERGGFLRPDDVRALEGPEDTRLVLLLVRCGSGRFLAPAQDVRHFCDIIRAHAVATERMAAPGSDYVRDVSIPADVADRLRADFCLWCGLRRDDREVNPVQQWPTREQPGGWVHELCGGLSVGRANLSPDAPATSDPYVRVGDEELIALRLLGTQSPPLAALARRVEAARAARDSSPSANDRAEG